jgi:FkbM family methyltransferase
VLADVGARGGLRPNWATARRYLRLIGFEPDEREYARLAAQVQADGSSDQFVGVALHNRAGSVTLHLAKDRGLSSIFQPNRAFIDEFPDADRFDPDGTHEVRVDTLDAVLAERHLTDVDFVKVDTQGSELFVLQGARDTLRQSVCGVEVEVEFAPIYQGQPLFADVDAYMRDLGYQLFDLRSVYWKRREGRRAGGPWGQIVWADALYFRTVAGWRSALEGMDASARRSKVLRAMSVALLYGYVDYALALAHAFGDVFTGDERAIIATRLAAFGPADILPAFPGRQPLALAFRRLWRLFQPRAKGWSISDSDVGNLG